MKLRFNVIYGGIKSNIVLGSFLVILLSFGLIGGCSKSGGNSGQSGTNLRFTNVTVQAGLYLCAWFSIWRTLLVNRS